MEIVLAPLAPEDWEADCGSLHGEPKRHLCSAGATRGHEEDGGQSIFAFSFMRFRLGFVTFDQRVHDVWGLNRHTPRGTTD